MSMLTRKLLMAKARGFTISIEKMGEQNRLHTPSGRLADDYNRLRSETLKLPPDLEPVLPPSVKKYQGGGDSQFSEAGYDELAIYCEQIFQVVAESETTK